MSNLTTLTLSEEQLERLKAYQHSEHDSWVQTVEGILRVLPDADDVYEEGCLVCGRTAVGTEPIAEAGGVVRWFCHEVEGEALFHTNYFCSMECAAEQAEKEANAAPLSPDEVLVGGSSELRTTVTDTSFHLDGEGMEVGIDIPGAFDGESDLGREYAYVGEPVYVIEDDVIQQSGIVEDIIHEETWTGLSLSHGGDPVSFARIQLNHPEEQVRESYREAHAPWRETTCGECSDRLKWPEDRDGLPVKCPTCGAEVAE